MRFSKRAALTLTLIGCGSAAFPAAAQTVTPTDNGLDPSVPPLIVASVLPGARSVEIGKPATIFADIVNFGPNALENCLIALPVTAPVGLTLSYQATDPQTNAPIGTPDTPETILGNNGAQTFVLTFQAAAPFSVLAMPLEFECDGSAPAAIVTGVDTVDLTYSTTPVADILALAATPAADGIVDVPDGGVGAFAVASINVGVTAALQVSVDTGGATVPVAAALCQTDPGSGNCLATPSPALTLNYAADATPTFSVFVQANGKIPLAPATSRVFVRFEDAGGGMHGSTSVAVQSPPAVASPPREPH